MSVDYKKNPCFLAVPGTTLNTGASAPAGTSGKARWRCAGTAYDGTGLDLLVVLSAGTHFYFTRLQVLLWSVFRTDWDEVSRKMISPATSRQI